MMMQSTDRRKERKMSNGEWGIFVEHDNTVRNYYCGDCRIFTGTMRTRRISDSDNNVHKEYKIVCDKCGKNGTLHWSKNLAEHSWRASNPNFGEDYVAKNVDDIIKGRKESVEKRQP